MGAQDLVSGKKPNVDLKDLVQTIVCTLESENIDRKVIVKVLKI